MEKTKKPGGKPSNVELLAERKAIAALMDEVPGVDNEAKARWLLDEYNRLRNANAIAAIPIPDSRLSNPPELRDVIPAGDGLQPMSALRMDDPPKEEKPVGPIDHAHYPAPGEPSARINTQQVDNGPPQSTSIGDLTPAYARWYCSTHGPEATRQKYVNRTQHLPSDVRAALS